MCKSRESCTVNITYPFPALMTVTQGRSGFYYPFQFFPFFFFPGIKQAPGIASFQYTSLADRAFKNKTHHAIIRLNKTNNNSCISYRFHADCLKNVFLELAGLNNIEFTWTGLDKWIDRWGNLVLAPLTFTKWTNSLNNTCQKPQDEGKTMMAAKRTKKKKRAEWYFLRKLFIRHIQG